MDINDAEIIKAIRDGHDELVVKSIYDNVLPNVKNYVVSNNGSVDDAMDIFHDALIVFFRLVMNHKYDAEKYKVYGFVYTICRNLWINQSKKKNSFLKWSQSKEYETKHETGVLEELISDEKLSLVQKLLNGLGEKCVEILTLFMHHDLSYKEIAVKLNFESESAAKVKAFRCRKALAERIKKDKSIIEQLRS